MIPLTTMNLKAALFNMASAQDDHSHRTTPATRDREFFNQYRCRMEPIISTPQEGQPIQKSHLHVTAIDWASLGNLRSTLILVGGETKLDFLLCQASSEVGRKNIQKSHRRAASQQMTRQNYKQSAPEFQCSCTKLIQ